MAWKEEGRVKVDWTNGAIYLEPVALDDPSPCEFLAEVKWDGMMKWDVSSLKKLGTSVAEVTTAVAALPRK